MATALKVTPGTFPLTSSSMRIALLLGVEAGEVSSEEIRHHVLLDSEKKPRRKPVVAFGRRFDTITEAARWRISVTGRGVDVGKYGGPVFGSVDNWRQWIARQANQDCWEGFYWCE